MAEPATAFDHWAAIEDVISELDLIRSQLVEARRHSRTIRFYEVLLAHPIAGYRHHVGDAVELSEGWCVVHWVLSTRRSVDFYQSADRLRMAMALNGQYILSLVDISERDIEFAPRASQTRSPLTEGERAALSCLVDGTSNREIGNKIGRSEQTVKNLLRTSYKKLDVTGRTQAALLARDLQLLPDATTDA